MDALWTPQYYQKVMALDPIAYWMLDEKSSTVAYDMVSGRVAGAQNGAYTGVTLGQPGIGDGRTSPLYDGANDYTNVFSAPFAAAFNGVAGTLAIWARVSGAGIWIDGANRTAVRIQADGDNYIFFRKDAVNNQVTWRMRVGGVAAVTQTAVYSDTAFFHMAATWTGGNIQPYLNGAPVGAPLPLGGEWAGAPAATTTVIGAAVTTPLAVWSGTLAHCPVWDHALSPTEMEDLAVIE